jgi:hypothetical protein
MVRILRLQRTHQDFRFGKTAQLLETSVFHKKRPARESGTDTRLQPFKSRFWAPQQRENASDLIVGVVSMSEGLCARASPSQTLQSGFNLSSQSIKHTLKTDEEWFFRQEPQRFTEQNFRLFPIPRHHGWLRSKIVRILVAWVLGSPRLDLFLRQIELSTPDVDQNDAVTDLPPGIKGSSSLIHSTSVIKHSDVRQNRCQAVVSMRQVILQRSARLSSAIASRC